MNYSRPTMIAIPIATLERIKAALETVAAGLEVVK